MQVRSLIDHEASDDQVHPAGSTYELPDGSLELRLRLKDGIVCAAAIPDPAPVAAPAPAPAE